MDTLNAVISTNSGCEQYLIEELGEWGYEGEVLKPAKVKVKNVKAEDIVLFNLALRQAHRVFILLAEGEAENPKEVASLVDQVDLSSFIEPGQSFAIRGKREGKHSFTSMDIAREVGARVIENYLKTKGVRLKVNLDEPDVEINAELSHNKAHLLLNTSGPALYNRYPRPFQHFAPLKPTIAASLIRVSSLSPGKVLLDPMAGGGTILTEAWALSKGKPPWIFKEREYLFQKLSIFSTCDIDAIKQRSFTDPWQPELRLLGADISPKNVRGMKENFEAIGLNETRIWVGDAQKLDYLSEPVDLIITNPPYGLRVASKRMVQKLYYRFAKACAEKRVPELVVLTAEGKLMAHALEQRGYQIKLRYPILYGKLWTDMVKAVW